jgi:hypothetical protein
MKAAFLTQTENADYIVQMDYEAYFKCFGMTTKPGGALKLRDAVIDAEPTYQKLVKLETALSILKAA